MDWEQFLELAKSDTLGTKNHQEFFLYIRVASIIFE